MCVTRRKRLRIVCIRTAVIVCVWVSVCDRDTALKGNRCQTEGAESSNLRLSVLLCRHSNRIFKSRSNQQKGLQSVKYNNIMTKSRCYFSSAFLQRTSSLALPLYVNSYRKHISITGTRQANTLSRKFLNLQCSIVRPNHIIWPREQAFVSAWLSSGSLVSGEQTEVRWDKWREVWEAV